MADDTDAAPQPEWEGPFDEAGLPHGTGLMSYPPPSVPEDEEEQEEPKPGDTYQGQMEHGKKHGQGKYTWGAAGAVYEGEYVDNRRQGLGSMTFPDKSKYEGSFAADQLDGDGVYYYSNGDIYSGGFRAGKKHGSGQMYFKAQSCMFVGVWADGQFVDGKWVQQEGTTFKGSFEGSVPKTGIFSFSNGFVQYGTYSNKGWKAELSA